ncbi:hypothetical protein QQP08_019906 [Theobroma cacao]|nr:hypothetical protein QQP08_019906 [Theobroma cacao]
MLSYRENRRAAKHDINKGTFTLFATFFESWRPVVTWASRAAGSIDCGTALELLDPILSLWAAYSRNDVISCIQIGFDWD